MSFRNADGSLGGNLGTQPKADVYIGKHRQSLGDSTAEELTIILIM